MLNSREQLKEAIKQSAEMFGVKPTVKSDTAKAAAPTATLTVKRQVWLELQALIHSIAFMQALPDDHQMPADLRDACALARSMASPALASLVLDVKKRTGIVIDLWPDNLSSTAKEQHERKAFLQTFAIMMDEYQRALSDFAARNPLHGGEAA